MRKGMVSLLLLGKGAEFPQERGGDSPGDGLGFWQKRAWPPMGKGQRFLKDGHGFWQEWEWYQWNRGVAFHGKGVSCWFSL